MGRNRKEGDGVKKRGKIWYTDFYASDGRYVDKSLRTRVKAEALALLAARREQEEERIREGGSSTGTLRTKKVEVRTNLLADMEAWDLQRAREKEVNEGTYGMLTYAWTRLRRHLKSSRQISRSGLQDYVRKRRTEGLDRNPDRKPSNKTLQTEMQALKRGLSEFAYTGRSVPLLRRRDWPPLPCRRKDRDMERRGHAYVADHLKRLLTGLQEERHADHHIALTTLHALTGIRWKEVRRVTPSMLVRDPAFDGMVVLRLPDTVTKSGEPRNVPLVPAAYRALLQLLSLPRIMSCRRAIDRTERRIGLEHGHARSMRMTFINACGSFGKDRICGKYLAGHLANGRDVHEGYHDCDADTDRCVKVIRAATEGLGFGPEPDFAYPEH